MRGGELPIPLDGWDNLERMQKEPRHGITPELEYDRAWARQLLASVMERLEAVYATAGKTTLFEALRDRLEMRSEAAPYDETAAALGMSEGAVRVGVFKLRKRYRDMLQAAIAETVASREDLADEVNYLMSVFAEP